MARRIVDLERGRTLTMLSPGEEYSDEETNDWKFVVERNGELLAHISFLPNWKSDNFVLPLIAFLYQHVSSNAIDRLHSLVERELYEFGEEYKKEQSSATE